MKKIILTTIVATFWIFSLSWCNIQQNQQNNLSTTWQKLQIQKQNKEQNQQKMWIEEKPLTWEKLQYKNQPKEWTQQQTKLTNWKFYTLDDVRKHNIPGDCRTIINSKVYDLSSFFGKHPWWDEKLAQLCGIDWTEKFMQKHGNNEKVVNKLKLFYIWDLATNESK